MVVVAVVVVVAGRFGFAVRFWVAGRVAVSVVVAVRFRVAVGFRFRVAVAVRFRVTVRVRFRVAVGQFLVKEPTQ